MKKAVLLLCTFCLSSFAFAQISSRASNHSTDKSVNPYSISAAFTKLEQDIFTQSTPQEVISTYLNIGEKQRQLGHWAEATAFYQRAYQLTTIHFRQYPNKKNPLLQIQNGFQYLLALCLPGSSLSGQSLDSIAVDQYLLEAQSVWLSATEITKTRDKAGPGLSEEKVVAAFFHAATEPSRIEQYRLSKNTSLRQEATHRSQVLKRLQAGCNLTVIEKTSEHWWKVETEDGMGYVKAFLLE